jgi:hypothetical protein
LLEALNAEDGKWQIMPFPEDKIPAGHRVASLSGTVKGATFLVVAYWVPGVKEARYDGTAVLPPAIMAHLPPTVAQAAYKKGKEWLERNQPPATKA